MALVNPNIALGFRMPEFRPRNALAEYAQVQQIQSGQQAQELNALKMQEAQLAVQERNALNQAYQSAYNPNTGEIDTNALRKSLSTGGFGSKLPALEKSLSELAQQKLTQEKLKGEVAAQPVKLAADKVKLLDDKLKQQRSFLDTLDPNDPSAPARYMQWHEANHADPDIGAALAARGITVDQSRDQIQRTLAAGPQAFAAMINASKLGTEKFMEMNKPQLSTKDTGGELVDRTFEPLTGKITEVGRTPKTMAPGEEKRLQNDATRIKQEGQRIGLEGRRVAVLEQNSARDADPAFQQRMEGARTVGRKAAEGDIAAVQALPKVITRAEEGMRLIDELIGKRDTKTGQLLKGEKTHPGFQNAVGATWLPGARFVPGTDAASFMSRFDQIKGASFLEAFESLKGGGAITEKEGAKGTDAINRMSIATDEKEFVRAAMDLQDVIRKGVTNAQGRAARAGGGAAPAAGGVIDFGSLK
jgi:hypothetical protein